MTILEYRNDHGLSLEAFGALIGRSKATVCAIEQTGRCPAHIALKIEQVTGGKVNASSLNPEIALARAA